MSKRMGEARRGRRWEGGARITNLEGRWSDGGGLNLTRGGGGGAQVKENGRGDSGERREGQVESPTTDGRHRTWWLKLGVIAAIHGVEVAIHHQLDG